jgi:hypothetical protein
MIWKVAVVAHFKMLPPSIHLKTHSMYQKTKSGIKGVKSGTGNSSDTHCKNMKQIKQGNDGLVPDSGNDSLKQATMDVGQTVQTYITDNRRLQMASTANCVIAILHALCCDEKRHNLNTVEPVYNNIEFMPHLVYSVKYSVAPLISSPLTSIL